jgi:hypothetical protein
MSNFACSAAFVACQLAFRCNLCRIKPDEPNVTVPFAAFFIGF